MKLIYRNDLSGKEVIPENADRQLENAFFDKYKETRKQNMRYVNWGYNITTECNVVNATNHVTYDCLVVRVWYNTYPVITFDILGHSEEAIFVAKEVMEEYVKEMTEYYKNTSKTEIKYCKGPAPSYIS